MADERAYLYRNTGTKASPVWEKWYPRTMADAVETEDGREIPLIQDGRFVLGGTEELNKELDTLEYKKVHRG